MNSSFCLAIGTEEIGEILRSDRAFAAFTGAGSKVKLP